MHSICCIALYNFAYKRILAVSELPNVEKAYLPDPVKKWTHRRPTKRKFLR